MNLLTQGAECRLLDGGQTAVVHGQVPDVERQEEEALQLGQVVVPQLQVEDDWVAALQRLHRPVDVRHVRRLAENVQAILLHLAHARVNVADLRTRLLTGLARNHIDENVHDAQDNNPSHLRGGDPPKEHAHTHTPSSTTTYTGCLQ